MFILGIVLRVSEMISCSSLCTCMYNDVSAGGISNEEVAKKFSIHVYKMTGFLRRLACVF